MGFLEGTLAVGNDILDAQLEVAKTEGFGEILVGTDTESLFTGFFLSVGSNEDDGQVTVDGVALYCLCQLKSVHICHHDI